MSSTQKPVDKKTAALKKTLKGVRRNEKLSKHTAIGIGGPARWYFEACSRDSLLCALQTSVLAGVETILLGGAANVVPHDKEIKALVIRHCDGDCAVAGGEISCDAGVALGRLVETACAAGLEGFDKMAGIPGTVGGALYGNAGAFGQTISDHLVSVDVWNGKKVVTVPRARCGFGYRHSIFKQKSWVIVGATFASVFGDAKALKQSAADTIALRESRYDTSIKTPGSYFKNVEVKKIPKKILASLDPQKIQNGRIPAGYLLDLVDSKGMQVGGASVTSFHSNWIYNKKRATAKDVKALAAKLKKLVKKKFGVELQEEVQHIG